MSIDYVIVDDLGHRHGLINKQVNHNIHAEYWTGGASPWR